ncbi:MAG TPA: hypothetical protein PKY81_09435 [bacterium]|nr:hypothetical protein [bacterium]HPN31167.1 hypothetical protein [bacterium]
MKKYNVVSIISESSSENIQKNILAAFENIDEAFGFLDQIFVKNKYNPEMKDVYFDGKILTMFNSGANCYSSYKVIEIEE